MSSSDPYQLLRHWLINASLNTTDLLLLELSLKLATSVDDTFIRSASAVTVTPNGNQVTVSVV